MTADACSRLSPGTACRDMQVLAGTVATIVYSAVAVDPQARSSCLQIWKYQPWLKTMLLGVLRSLEASEKPIVAIHVKAPGSSLVQASVPAVC